MMTTIEANCFTSSLATILHPLCTYGFLDSQHMVLLEKNLFMLLSCTWLSLSCFRLLADVIWMVCVIYFLKWGIRWSLRSTIYTVWLCGLNLEYVFPQVRYQMVAQEYFTQVACWLGWGIYFLKWGIRWSLRSTIYLFAIVCFLDENKFWFWK